MNYLLKPKPKKDPALRGGLVAVLVFALAVSGLYLAGGDTAYGLFGRIAKPLWSLRERMEASVGTAMTHFESKESLIRENAELKSMIQADAEARLENIALRTENEQLKGLSIRPGLEPARVLSNPAQSFYDILSVELKPDSKVFVGAIVYGSSSAAIGTVIDVHGTVAKIELFSSSGITTNATLQTSGTSILLTGEGGGSFTAVVPRSLAINAGDMLALPQFENTVIGVVGATERGRSDSFQNVYAVFPFNVFKLNWVAIQHAQ